MSHGQTGFDDLLRIWKPESRAAAMIIRWRVTEWCNYACEYCHQERGRFVDRGNGLTSHAFDNFPVAEWQSAFSRHFDGYRLSLTITGGEPFLDRPAMVAMLNFLTGLPGTECIRIDTNASWNPEAFGELDRSKIILNCSFHSAEVEEGVFVRNLRRILDGGFHVGMVNYVMVKEHFDRFAERRLIFAKMGVPLNPNPDFARATEYSAGEAEMLQAHLPELDYEFKVLRASPQGRECLYPAIAFELDYRGTIRGACLGSASASIFDESLPAVPSGPVACPNTRCECLDMYSFLKGSTRNRTTNPLQDYVDEMRSIRSAGRLKDRHEKPGVREQSRLVPPPPGG